MKKFLWLLVFVSCVSLIGMEAEKFTMFEAPDFQAAHSKKTELEKLPNYDLVILQSQDGRYFVVPKSLINLSKTIANLLQDANPDDIIPLPNITGKTLRKIIGFMRIIQENSKKEKDEDKKPIDLSGESAEDLTAITVAANYLDIESLLAAVTEQYAQSIFSADLDKLKTEASYKKYQKEFLDTFSKDSQRAIINGGMQYLISDQSMLVLVTLKYKATVSSVALSPDGTKIVTRLDDHTVRVWQINDEQPAVTLSHNDAVWSVAFSPDGTKILTGSTNEARLWQIDRPNQSLATFIHDGMIMSVAFSSDGTRILTGSDDGTVRLWQANPSNPQLLATFKNDATVTFVAFSPDGTKILTNSVDGTARLWQADPNNPKLLHKFKETKPILSVAFSPDGTKILTKSGGTVWLWRVQSNGPKLLATFEDERMVGFIAFTSDGTKIVTMFGGTARLWQIEAGEMKLLATINAEGRINVFVFSLDGTRIVTTLGGGRTVQLWKLPEIDKLDLKSAQIMMYVLKYNIQKLDNLPEYLRKNLNEYAKSFLFLYKATMEIEETVVKKSPAPETAWQRLQRLKMGENQ